MALEYLNKDELRKVLAVAVKYGARETCMIALAYGHALRASEIISLTLADVRGGKIACRRAKKSEHTVELLRSNEIDALTNWLRERGDGDGSCFLFTSRQGSRMSRQQFYNLFRKIAELAGLESGRVHPHILKHSYASHMIRAGVSLAHVQVAMGHAHISSTVRYTHITVSEAQAKSNTVIDSILAA
jgi:integrase/recombinase XerD